MFAKIEEIAQKRFTEQWASRTPIQWPGVPFDPPADQKYVAFFIKNGDGQQASMGASKIQRQFGIVIIQAFGPANSGLRDAKVLADAAAAAMRFTQVKQDGVTVDFESATCRDVDVRGGSYSQINVIVNYKADAFFT